MVKTIRLISLFVIILLISCSRKIEFNQERITKVIQKIEYSINNDNLIDYRKNSNALTFFNFNSILCGVAKIANKERSDSIFTIKPFTFESKGKYIRTEVFLNYLIDIKIDTGDFDIDIPPELLQKIINIGLPNKAFFYFSVIEDQYLLTKVKYPLRYKYMELLQKYL